MNHQANRQDPVVQNVDTSNLDILANSIDDEACMRRRLCLIIKLLSSSMDSCGRQRLRLTIRHFISLSKDIKRSLPNGFIDDIKAQVCAQVGLKRWNTCETIVDRFLEAKLFAPEVNQPVQRNGEISTG